MSDATDDAALDVALKLARRFEGLRLTAYQDAVGVWTVGYGCTVWKGQPVHEGLAVTADEAEAALRAGMASRMQHVDAVVRVPVSAGQAGALCDFAYNLGIHALEESTLLRLLNQGDYHGAAGQFGRWVHAGGRVLEGLVKRRAAEREEFVADLDPQG